MGPLRLNTDNLKPDIYFHQTSQSSVCVCVCVDSCHHPSEGGRFGEVTANSSADHSHSNHVCGGKASWLHSCSSLSLSECLSAPLQLSSVVLFHTSFFLSQHIFSVVSVQPRHRLCLISCLHHTSASLTHSALSFARLCRFSRIHTFCFHSLLLLSSFCNLLTPFLYISYLQKSCRFTFIPSYKTPYL